jgi:cold-inducible RNA-binding protein
LEISVTKLFVGNLSFRTTQDDLLSAFSPFGAVESVNVINDRDTGQPRGFAFVEMTSASEAESAIRSLNGTELGGRNINVNEARPRGENGGGRASNGSGRFDNNRRSQRW